MFFSQRKKQLYIGLLLLLLVFICSKNTVHAAFGDASGLSSYQYWGKQLTEEEYRIYNEMLKSSERGERKTLQMEYHYEHIWDMGEDGIRQYVSNMVARAYSAFTYDYPLYRPANYSYYYTLEGNMMKLSVSFEEFYDGFWADLPDVETSVFHLEEQILQNYSQNVNGKEMEGVLSLQFDEDYEDFLLLEEIYRTVIKNTTYSFAIDEISNSMTDIETFSVSAAVLDKFHRHSVCSGYSGLFQILCNDLGISCIQVSNDGVNVEAAHSYNFVNLQDDWYMVDPTWGDEGDSIDWDSFLCGSKVSLDGRRLGSQLANPYVAQGFVNPVLKDCFYKTLTFQEVEPPDPIIYDAIDFSAMPYTVQVTTYPFCQAVMDSMDMKADGIPVEGKGSSEITVMLNLSCDFSIGFSGKFLQEEKQADFHVIRYPLCEVGEKYVEVIGLTNRFIPSSILCEPACDYVFHKENSNTSFYMEERETMQYFEGDEVLSLECCEGVFKDFVLPLSFKREERKRSQTDPLFILSFPEWSEPLRKGTLVLDLSETLEVTGLQEQGVFYVVGCDEQGNIAEIGEVSLSNGRLSGFTPESPVLFFYEKPWKQAMNMPVSLCVCILACICVLLIGGLYIRAKKKSEINKID